MAKLNLSGTLSTLFQIGRRSPIIRSLANTLSARSSNNSAFVEFQAADPTSDDSLATKRYVDLNASSGTIGTALVDFGSFPGSSDTTVDVSGQSSIVLSSIVEAWIIPADTADHTLDEHVIDSPSVYAGNVISGVGFTLYAVTKDQKRKYGQWSVGWRWK